MTAPRDNATPDYDPHDQGDQGFRKYMSLIHAQSEARWRVWRDRYLRPGSAVRSDRDALAWVRLAYEAGYSKGYTDASLNPVASSDEVGEPASPED